MSQLKSQRTREGVPMSDIFKIGTVVIYKQPHYCAGMYIALKLTEGKFWQQISPNYTYRKSLINWCKKNGYDPVNA